MLDRSGIPLDIEKYTVSPQELNFRKELTDQEKSTLKKRRMYSAVVAAIFSAVTITAGYFVSKIMIDLSEHGAGSAEKNILYYSGIALFAVCIINALRVILRVIIVDYGVCDKGIIVRTFRTVTYSHDPTNSYSAHTNCVGVWFPETNQYCRTIEYFGNNLMEFDSLIKGQTVNVYKLGKGIYFANCPTT